MRAIVTGGAGFIGSNLVDALLERGDDVEVVDNLATGKRENLNATARFRMQDIRDDGLELDADVVFHLAAQADVNRSVHDPLYDSSVNVAGTLNVLEAARRADAQVVFSSTGGAIYGEVERPADEQTPRRPMSPYGIAKLCGEAYPTGWNRIHGTRHVVLRFANVYGPRQDSGLEGGVVAIYLERMARGEGTAIFGDGEQTRDFVHVDDVVQALLAAPAHGGGIFNVGTGEETSVNRLHELCRRVSGAGSPPEYQDARLGDARRSVLDVSLIERELGWRPAVSLEDGLRRTWDWTRASL